MSRRAGEAGLGLVELLLAMAIFAIVMTMVMVTVGGFAQSATNTDTESAATGRAQLAMDVLQKVFIAAASTDPAPRCPGVVDTPPPQPAFLQAEQQPSEFSPTMLTAYMGPNPSSPPELVKLWLQPSGEIGIGPGRKVPSWELVVTAYPQEGNAPCWTDDFTHDPRYLLTLHDVVTNPVDPRTKKPAPLLRFCSAPGLYPLKRGSTYEYEVDGINEGSVGWFESSTSNVAREESIAMVQVELTVRSGPGVETTLREAFRLPEYARDLPRSSSSNAAFQPVYPASAKPCPTPVA